MKDSNVKRTSTKRVIKISKTLSNQRSVYKRRHPTLLVKMYRGKLRQTDLSLEPTVSYTSHVKIYSFLLRT